jgi:prepilin-type N-terminal cleavage/methylation domain-containing protein
MQRKAGKNSRSGFTLLEMIVALAIGMIILAAALQLYTKALDMSYITQQRAEMQLDVRAAQNMLVKDVGLAGSGLNPGGIALVSGTGVTSPIYPGDQSGGCSLPQPVPSCLTFPTTGSPATNYMYWIIPGNANGTTISAARGATDTITVVYADPIFPFNDYTISFNNAQGNSIKFTELPDPPSPPVAPYKPNVPGFIKISDPARGLKKGDLILFTNKDSTGNTQQTIGEVTTTPTGVSGPWNVAFAALDPLKFNQQVGGQTGGLPQAADGVAGTTSAMRLYIISYFIANKTNPITNVNTPTLYRQINGQAKVPVAENIVDLKILYEVYDDAGNLTKDVANPTSPNSIHRVVVDMTARTPMRGVLARNAGNQMGYSSINLHNSISTRNMSFKDRYPE